MCGLALSCRIVKLGPLCCRTLRICVVEILSMYLAAFNARFILWGVIQRSHPHPRPPNRTSCLTQQNIHMVCDILSGAQFIRKHHTTPLILQRKHNHVYHHPRRCCQCCWVKIGLQYSCLCRKFELWRLLRIVRALYCPPWTTLLWYCDSNEPKPQVP